MAPPLTLVRSSSRPSWRTTATTWAANASFSSTRAISSSERPALRSALGTASTGPMPMIAGSTPAVAKLTSRPSGVSPSCAARSPVITTSAAAPSLIWLLLPAVTVPPAAKTGLSSDVFCASASWRIPSSASKVTSRTVGRPSSSTSVRCAVTGTISSWKRPARCAADARWWERRPHAS